MEQEKRNAKGQTLNEFLDSYDPSVFDKPAVTADCLVFAGKGMERKVLVIKRGNHPCIGEWALPGGFCEKGEPSENTALRELEEETGNRFEDLSQLCFVSTPGRDPRDWIMTVCYIGIADEPFEVQGGDDAAEAEWADILLSRQDDCTVLTLKTRYETVSASVRIVRDSCGVIDINKSKVIGRGIAFDHAKIILLGLESFGDKPRSLNNGYII